MGAKKVILNWTFAEFGAVALLHHPLPGLAVVEVAGVREFFLPIEIAKVLPAARASPSDGVVHRDFVKGMRVENLVPPCGVFAAEDWQEAARNERAICSRRPGGRVGPSWCGSACEERGTLHPEHRTVLQVVE